MTRTKRLLLGAVIVAAAALPARAATICDLSGAPPEGLVARYARYVAAITVTNTQYSGEEEPNAGSGFLLTFGGYVVTAAHVVDDPRNFETQKIKVAFDADAKLSYDAILVASDPEKDVALLRLVPPQNFTAFRSRAQVFNRPPLFGAGLGFVILGFPAQSRTVVTQYPGCVAGVWGPYLLSTATQNAASSGSPAITSAGEIVAFAEGKISEVASSEWGGTTVKIDDGYLIGPVSLADALMQGIAATPPAAPEASYDLSAAIEKYYKPPPLFDLRIPVDAKAEGFNPLGGTFTFSQAFKLPSDAQALSCSVIANNQQSEASGQDPKCRIDVQNGTANVSVGLDKPALFNDGGAFQGTVTVNLRASSLAGVP